MASVYAQLTSTIHPVHGTLEVLFDRPGLGRHRAHDRLLELWEEAHNVLRDTCLRMVEVGGALVETADAYAATDQAAADEFGRLLEENGEDYEDGPVYVPQPPGPDDPIHVPPV